MQTEHSAQLIIAQIESTHPNDAAGLDKIDQQVAQFLSCCISPSSEILAEGDTSFLTKIIKGGEL